MDKAILLPVLQQCPLFAYITPGDIPTMLDCLSARFASYAKDETVFAAGGAITHMGIVLYGKVHVTQDDYWGNRTILTVLGPAELFGEAFSCAGVAHLPVNVHAADKTSVLLVDTRKIISGSTAACSFHTQLVQNMLRILAQKNVFLTQKMETITQRTTRGKLLAFLSQQAQASRQSRFVIPFNRQQLADYLSVDRSAMSTELANMQREGLLLYRKNQFELL